MKVQNKGTRVEKEIINNVENDFVYVYNDCNDYDIMRHSYIHTNIIYGRETLEKGTSFTRPKSMYIESI